MVEFALTMVLLAMLLAAVFDVGRGIWAYSSITHAAKAAAQFGIRHSIGNPVVNGNGDNVTTQAIKERAAEQAVWLGLTTSDVTVTYDASNVRGQFLKVRINYNSAVLLGPLLGLGPNMAMTAQSRMMIVN